MKIIKSFSLQTKDISEAGKVRAVIATMNVADKDGDVTLPGFFGMQEAVVVPVHDWDHVPIGKAMVHEEGSEAIADIQLNLELQAAKDWLAAMKFDLEQGKPLMEWSYGFKIMGNEAGSGSSIGEFQGHSVRFLRPMPDGSAGCKIWEVSPVLVGAGEGTRTLAAKSIGQTFLSEAQAALDAVDGLLERASSLADLRAKDGRSLSAVNMERLAALGVSLSKAATEIARLIKPAQDPEARKEWARYILNSSGLRKMEASKHEKT